MDDEVPNVGRVLPLLLVSLLSSEVEDCNPQPVPYPGSWRTAPPGPHPLLPAHVHPAAQGRRSPTGAQGASCPWS